MNALLLPGLHGDSRLFEALCELIKTECHIIRVSYPNTEFLSYEQLAQWATGIIPAHEDFFIITESFSGPIAYLLSLHHPKHLKFIVYGASFVDTPGTFLIKLRELAPYLLKLARLVPQKWLARLLLGKHCSTSIAVQFNKMLRMLPDGILQFRLNLIANLSLPNQIVNGKAIYLRPRFDYLVSERGFHSVAIRYSQVTRHDLNGTHFLFQSNPGDCAEIIVKEIKKQAHR